MITEKKENHEKILLISLDEWENRAVLLENGKITEFYAERRFRKYAVNSIFLGRIKEVRPSLNSAFVNIGLSRNAFLSFENMYEPDDLSYESPKLEKGKEIIVMLVRPPYKTKGARVSAKISLAGRYVVYFPGVPKKFVNVSRKIPSELADDLIKRYEKHIAKNCGIILRTAALEASEDIVKKEISMLCERWENIRRLASKKSAPAILFNEESFPVRIIREVYSTDHQAVFVDDRNAYHEILRYGDQFVPGLKEKVKLYDGERPMFEAFHIESQLNDVFSRTITIPSGGYIVIDRREAMTVIDVNSGRYTEGYEHEEMSYRVNMEAAQEIVRQIRLRNIGGIIIVDFIDMKNSNHKEKLFNYLSELLQNDRAYTYMETIPSLTLAAFTRKTMSNISYSFYEEECEACKGSGWQVSIEARAVQILRKIKKIAAEKSAEAVVVRINEKIYREIKAAFSESIRELEKRFKKSLIILGSAEISEEEAEVVMIGKKDDVLKHFQGK